MQSLTSAAHILALHPDAAQAPTCARILLQCSLYNNIKPPSWLQPGTDFHLFKEGIQPKWEDPSCENGGKWTILVPRGNKQILDKFWLHSVNTGSFCRNAALGFPVKTYCCSDAHVLVTVACSL